MKDFRKLLRKLVLMIAIITASSILMVPQVGAMIDKQMGNFLKMLYSPSANVTITAIPAFGSMPLTDFQVNQVQGDVVCTWTNPPTGVAAMIRAKYGSFPMNITDGYQVFYGAGSTANDLGVNIDDNIQTIYYMAWAENAVGLWSTAVTDIFEVSKMALIIVTIALLGLAFWQRSNFLMILAGVVAIGFGAYWIAEYDGFIYVIEGAVAVAIGFYLLVSSALELIRGQ